MSTAAKEQPDDTKETKERARPRAPKVVHLTEADAPGAGKSAREQSPRAGHAAARIRRARPGRDRRRRHAVACPGARADSLRAHARLAVHLLPRRARLMAHDLAAGRRGPERAALRRCPPLELRRLRVARPRISSSTSTTSTRRTSGRSSGTSSASLRASRSPAATAASQTPSAGMSCCAVVRAYREAMRAVRRDEQPRRSGTRASTSRSSMPRLRGAEAKAQAEGGRASGRQGAHEGQPEGFAKLTQWSTASRASSPTRR